MFTDLQRPLWLSKEGKGNIITLALVSVLDKFFCCENKLHPPYNNGIAGADLSRRYLTQWAKCPVLGESGREAFPTALGPGRASLWAGRGGDGSQGCLSPVSCDLGGIGRKLNLKPPNLCVLQAVTSETSLDLPIPLSKWRSGGGKGCWGIS